MIAGMVSERTQLPLRVADSVVRGASQGDSHGGIGLIESRSKQVQRMADWNTTGLDFRGRGERRTARGPPLESGCRGFGGVALAGVPVRVIARGYGLCGLGFTVVRFRLPGRFG